MRSAFLVLCWLGCALHGYGQELDAIDALFQWVRDLGGEINAEVKLNSKGVRGLFATKAIGENENIASIPAATIINAGSLNDSFAVPTLTVLRELKNPHSRFKPYIATWPKPGEIINSCTLGPKYAEMMKAPFWERSVKDWGQHLEALHAGHLDADLEITVKEMVGNVNVTLEEIQYACAVSSTRYVSTARRRRLLMAPIFDLANHERLCPHALSSYEGGDFMHFVAGAPLKPGDEICYSYGNMRDDYAVVHYGFLPELEDPPRLALVDHREHNSNSLYSHDDPPSDEPFDGEPAEIRAELQRLRAVHSALRSTPDPLPPQPRGVSYVYDMLKELEQRRLAALEYEIRRLSFVVDDEKSEL